MGITQGQTKSVYFKQYFQHYASFYVNTVILKFAVLMSTVSVAICPVQSDIDCAQKFSVDEDNINLSPDYATRPHFSKLSENCYDPKLYFIIILIISFPSFETFQNVYFKIEIF